MSPNLLQQFEFLLGSIGVTLALFFGGFLLITKKKQPKANLFLAIYLLAFAFRIGKSLFHYDFEIPEMIRTGLIATLYVIGPSIYLYCDFWKYRRQQVERRHWMHFIPFVVLFLLSPWVPNDGTSRYFAWFYNGTILSILGYTIYSLWALFGSNRSSETNNSFVQSWLRFFLIANLILVVIYALVSTVLPTFYTGIGISFSLLIVICSIRALKYPHLFQVDKVKYGQSKISSDSVIQLSNKLDVLMKQERPYLDPELNLSKLSAMLEVGSKELSQVINQAHGKNYAQYVVAFRIQEALRLLKSKDHAHLSIAAIAYDSGFNSISSFNSQFKKQMGMTAKDFRARI